MKTMGIDDIGEYKENLYQLLNIFTHFEDAPQNGEPNEEVINFIREDLSSVYNTLGSLKEDIEKVSLSKNPLIESKNYFQIEWLPFYIQT